MQLSVIADVFNFKKPPFCGSYVARQNFDEALGTDRPYFEFRRGRD